MGDLSVSEFCHQMKGMADSLGDLGWPVEDRILVLNVLRGLSDRYSYLRMWITRQRPFPTFLQVCDDLVMEELTQGLQPGSTSASGSSSSSTAHAATPPPRPAPPPQSSLLVLFPWAERGWGAVAGDVEQVVGAARRRHPHEVHPGHPSATHGQGAYPCGHSRLPVVSLVGRWPCSLVFP